jgi:hypothetical protein
MPYGLQNLLAASGLFQLPQPPSTPSPDMDSYLRRRAPHIPPMPGFGRASIDRAGELDGIHLAANNQQAADLALDPAHSGSFSRDKNV